ncbi:PKD domain-containing protein [Danxiaibacter flavus]|uniref:PKD domain-containing protein n=1 Tax=Danxiaibacter flavus TaxID=3049108 RepID=A0ABV3ZCT8_9BACT|nr:PKD domain-containing protein [Chitinophagaceae bacterium DXS]
MFYNRNIFKIALLPFLVAVLVLVNVIGVKKLLPANEDVIAIVYPRVISLKDTMFFVDSTSFAKQQRWLFGDGSQSFSASGYHQYERPGNYTVLLTINNKYTDTFFVTVKDTARVYAVEDSITYIQGPQTGMQFENLVFRAGGKGAQQYRWRFGETSTVDSRESFVQYFYQAPGDYTVLLYTDNSEYPARHTIHIDPSFKASQDSILNFDSAYRQRENDFKFHLQQIADGNNFNKHYYYLLDKYLCRSEKIAVKINGQKINDFSSYCLGLQFDKDVEIQSVKLILQEDLKCMKLIEVKQGRELR